MDSLQQSIQTHRVVLTVGIAVAVTWFVKRWMTRPKNFPPGPRGLPLLGVAWSVIRAKPDPLNLFGTWADKYGDIMSFKVGPMRVVMLNSYQAVVDAFQHPDLNDRPVSKFVDEVLGINNHGILMASGKVWREQRNFAHTVFRSLGIGKKSYEDTIAAEMAQLMAAIEEKGGASFNPGSLLQQAISNIICTVAFGTQYKYTDTDFQGILHRLNENMRLGSGAGVLFFLPIPGISKIPFGAARQIANNMRTSNAFFVNQIEAHEKNLDPENPRDMIDLYLNKIAETKGTDASFDKINLYAFIFDLFAAGTETTSTTMMWCILHMMAHPEVQSRVQAELDQVVGRNRLPRLDDRDNLPYTNAVLLEVQRRAAIGAFGGPHVAAADTVLHGYDIPKGTTVIPNLWQVLNNKTHWKEPEEFRPARFLSDDGKLKPREDLIIFSAGRRVCIGERLARMETFLCFTSLLHRFVFKKPENSPPLSFEGVLGMTRTTQPFEICAIKRED